MAGPVICFEYVTGLTRGDPGWQTIMPMADLIGTEDGALACLTLREGHKLGLPDSTIYTVASAIWRPWGLGRRRGTSAPPESAWQLNPHLHVLLRRLSEGSGERITERLDPADISRFLTGAG